jgi:ribosomal protein S18 acetylase RimI-like enzyme
VAPDPSRTDRRLLRDHDGRMLASFAPGERDGRPLADLVEPADGVPIAAVARQIAEEMPDWKVAGDVALGRALVALGARPTRHAHVHSRDLRRDPAPAEWADAPGIGPLDRTAAELVEIYAAAYPAGHVDWLYTGPPADYEADLAGVLDGRIAGPRLDASRLAVDAAGRPAGALIVTQLEGDPPFGGPWVAELFRRPGDDLRGMGRTLLQAGLAVATVAGLPALGLAVTEGNPAQALYEALGFARVLSSLTVVV